MEVVNVHASCVALGRQGVLLLGESGAGKSDLALRLIDEGARLVADDRTELFATRGRLHARAPGTIAGLIEARGLGLIALPFARQVKIALAVQLEAPRKRLPDAAFYAPPAPIKLVRPPPFIMLDGKLASAPARIRLALRAFAQDLFREDLNPT